MTKEQYKRLEPFLKSKSARQRVILYLLAIGYAVSELIELRVNDLRELKLPVEVQVYRDEVLISQKSGFAFVYPNGNQLPPIAFNKLVRATAEKVIGHPMSTELFKSYIQSAKRSN